MKEEKPVPAMAVSANAHSPAGARWLEVTNFAIDIGFMESAGNAADPEEFKKSLSSDHFFGFATLLDDSRPALERPGVVREETYRREYAQRVHAMIPVLSTTLQVVRDVLWFCEVRYEPKNQKFLAARRQSPDGIPDQFLPEFHILQMIFDYPDFEPFRFAYCVISRVTAAYSTFPRSADEGELAYSLRFKTFKKAPVAGTERTMNLGAYVQSHGRQKI
jgi:hypothetical protein